MLAIFYSLNTFKGYIKHSHVLIFSDNTTAVSVINHMGTSKSQDCNALAKSIWDFCQCEDIWLTISHIPGVDNVDADRESRKEYCDSNWKLIIIIIIIHHLNNVCTMFIFIVDIKKRKKIH